MNKVYSFILVLLTCTSIFAYDMPQSGSTTISTCSGVVNDPGGTSVYGYDLLSTMVIYPSTSGTKISLTFTSFDTEFEYDSLYIYDGISSSSRLIGAFTGSTVPGTYYATNASGALTLKFVSDYSTSEDGFSASIACYTPCSSPQGGQTVSSKSQVCPDVEFTLGTTGSSVGAGVTYQWQYSSNGSTWNNISAATGSTYTTTQSTAYYYRTLVSCTGTTTASASVLVGMSSGLCYCIYDLGGSTSDNISNVTISNTTLNNSSTVNPYNTSGNSYNLYPASGNSTGKVAKGNTYAFKVTTPDTDYSISLWIDYNQNGTFDENEWTQVSSGTTGITESVNIKIPATALVGLTGMRVRTRVSGSANGSSNACTSYATGETEDYFITIAEAAVACSGTPSAGTAISDKPEVCTIESFSLYLANETIATGLTYQWQSSPNGTTWTNINNATANPYVTTQAVTTYYRCKLSCGTNAAISGIVQVAQKNCYCNTGLGGGTCGTDDITNVKITNTSLNNSSFCNTSIDDDVYTRVEETTATVTLNRKSTYQLVLESNDSDMSASLWIDYNQNGLFESSEWTEIATASLGTTITNNFTIPAAAPLGKTGMRIRTRTSGFDNGGVDACTSFATGETEDYMITIGDPTAVGDNLLVSSNTALVPNPAHDYVKIQFADNSLRSQEILVTDVSGKEIMALRDLKNSSEIELNVSSLKSGLYLVHIQTEQGRTVKTLVVD